MVIAKSKKVRPSITNTIKSMDYTWTADTEPPADNQEATGVPTALFLPHGNTLPFEERRLTLEQPIKIGRNVYRATPAPNNAIFECRVLSRHHATLFYKNGHFYLIDNQSSNGTFINNDKKCSTKTEEPHEVFSGDIVKFGISVVENVPKTGLNTFPPVIAMLKLFHPDGKEAKMSFNPTMSVPLDLKELYQLHNFVQEAMGREASLEGRLKSLKDCATRTRAAAQSSWELFVGEQRLLMRVRTLENMLASGKHPESHHVAMLLDEKKNYQEVAQESLRAAHEQRFALEEMLERRSREASALQQHNCALRQAANNALTELQKLAGRCERKMSAARAAIAAAEGKEAAIRARLPQALYIQGSVQGEAKMLVLSADGDRTAEATKGSVEEAIKALPDYIKMLLPAHVLNKVGLKTVDADAKSAKEFELIINTNNHQNYEANECKEKGEKGEVSEKKEVNSSSEEEGSPEQPDICTDDEKQSRLNHDGVAVDEPESGRAEGVIPDNNANSTYTENDNRDDEVSKSGMDLPNILFIMSGLNDEIKALRDRLSAATSENQQLREIRDELLAANSEQKEDNPVEIEDAASYRARIAELQAQLSRSTVVEEANLAEIQRLASSAAVMHAELAFRPTRQDLDDLNDHLQHLKAELMQRDDVINHFNKDKSASELPISKADKATETEQEYVSENSKFEDGTMDNTELDVGKVEAEIDDLFKLDYEDDDETTESADTVMLDDDTAIPEVEVRVTDYVKIPDDERLISTLANGSLHRLEEELVRAKERWEEIAKEKAVLVEQLAALEKKHAFSPARILALMVPIIAIFTYWLLLPYVS